jgi:hypothetical protein
LIRRHCYLPWRRFFDFFDTYRAAQRDIAGISSQIASAIFVAVPGV